MKRPCGLPPSDPRLRAYLSIIGRRGGQARAKKMTKAQRLESSQKANAAKAKKRAP